MATYSYGTQPTDALNLNNITAVLNQIPDNTSKQITPKDVRDAIFTTWENIIFKPTGLTSGQGYIGLDSGLNGLTQSKVYFGKRRASSQDVMNSTLLNSDTDFFFFNNRSDVVLQNTKISILAGTNSSVNVLAPYLESKGVDGPSFSYIDLNIINDSTDSNSIYGGNINIGTSQPMGYTGGYVSINGMIFPKYITPGSTQSNSIDGYVLKYNSSGYLNWESSAVVIDSITSSGTVSISGSPVLINNQQTNFLTDSTPVVQAIGSIPIGYTFSNENIVEVVRKIIYPYLSPQVSFVLNATPSGVNPSSYLTSGSTGLIIEMGNLSTFTYTYTITKRSNDINSVTSGTIWSLPGVPISSTVTATSPSNPSTAEISTFGTKTFTLSVGDGTSTGTSSATINKVLPFFYGASTSTVNFASFNSAFVNNLTKNVKTKSDTVAPLVGNGICIYFSYPSVHGLLNEILDDNGFNIINSFTHSIVSLNSPNGYWSAQNYRVYIYTGGGLSPTTTSVGIPPTYTSSVNYQFKF